MAIHPPFNRHIFLVTEGQNFSRPDHYVDLYCLYARSSVPIGIWNAASKYTGIQRSGQNRSENPRYHHRRREPPISAGFRNFRYFWTLAGYQPLPGGAKVSVPQEAHEPKFIALMVGESADA